jgi:DNA modification methylase
MKPYYEHNGITIYHGDCREILPQLASESVDLVLADPPYNVGLDYDSHDDKMDSDAYAAWCRTWFIECKRVTKYSTVITPGMVSVPMWIADIERTHFFIAWTKQNNCSRNYIGKTSGFQTWEPILVYGKSKKCLLRDSVDCPISIQSEAAGHPCPKPLRLWKWIIEQFTDPGDAVLDPFLGSGTATRAAKDLGRRAIGIEKSEKYCEIAARRLMQEVMAI